MKRGMSVIVPAHPSEAPFRAIVARQPICDRSQRTFAYELLFREPATEQCVFDSGDEATSRVVFNFIVEIGLERLVGPAQAFINLTRDFMLGMNCGLLPRERVVLEILEDSIPDPDFLRELAVLKAKGYRFALDDFNFQEQLSPFLPYCTFIKVDLRLVDRQRLVREMPVLRALPVKLLAEKVETEEEFEFCVALGFDYFQGYFFCRPKIVSAATMPTNRLTLCRLLTRIQQPDVTSQEVESIVGEDPAMSYRLLRYINSAAVSIPRKIESIKHAVGMIGLERIRTLSSLVMLSSLDDKPRELIKTSVIRARMCQLLGQGQSGQHDSYFTTGLFSTLDAFLNCPMETALELLPLSDEIRAALLRHEGPLGRVLASVIAFELVDWDALDRMEIEPARIAQAYFDSVGWGEELFH
jgi:EAL and modified HD-GYP domain-containing signal transduction protein